MSRVSFFLKLLFALAIGFGLGMGWGWISGQGQTEVPPPGSIHVSVDTLVQGR
jgi:hypothetical protein